MANFFRSWLGKLAIPYLAQSVSPSSGFMIGVVFLIIMASLIQQWRTSISASLSWTKGQRGEPNDPAHYTCPICLLSFICLCLQSADMIPVQFCNISKAQLSTRTFFGLAHRHGDIPLDGWKNTLDCIMHLYRATLLPDLLVKVGGGGREGVSEGGRWVQGMMYSN